MQFEFRQEALAEMGPLEVESLRAVADLGFHFAIDNVTDLRVDFRRWSDLGFRFIKVAADRLLGSRIGTAAAHAVSKGIYGVMVAARGEDTELVPLEEVAGQLKLVPPDHEWILTARKLRTGLGD